MYLLFHTRPLWTLAITDTKQHLRACLQKQELTGEGQKENVMQQKSCA